MSEETSVTGISENIEASVDASIKAKKEINGNELLLKGKRIGISISDSPDLLKLGYSSMHLQDASIEFARYLLVHGATLVYGGDLRQGGFTFLFSELAKLYSSKETYNDFRFKNFFAWPIHLKLTRLDELDFKKNRVEIVKLPPPINVQVDPVKAVVPDTNENKAIWAKSLSFMREQITADTDARIFIGGQTKNYKGKYPGIIEEALLAMQDNKPVYLVGAFGGASKEIVDLIEGARSYVLSEEYQFSEKGFEEFVMYWNQTQPEKIDYADLSKFFRDYGLKKLCENNGLSEEENKRLFVSDNLQELIYYVLKGVHHSL